MNDVIESKDRIGTIFVVDDEPMVTTSLKTMLSLETKHLIHAFNNPLEALDKLNELTPDVVISDFSMPEMDGINFLKKVKEELPETTLILLTGYADKESAIEAINHVGIYRYIEKPWDNDDLKLNINNGLERAYLVRDLKSTIQQLNASEQELKETNQQLEALVEARTRDLQATYQKLQSIVLNTADGIITLNQNLEITSVNPTAQQWLASQFSDVEANTLLSIPLDEFLTVVDAHGRPEGNLQSLCENLQTRLFKEARMGQLPMEMSIAPVPDENGYVLVFRDITKRKEVERLRDDFVSTLTHDLRTPLLAAIQTLGFFTDGSLGDVPDNQKELLTMMVDSNRQMLGLVNVLLEVYKYEAGRQTLIFDQIDMSELSQSVAQELEALAKSREQSLEIDVPEKSLSIKGDKQELRRVMVNLIGNAINHTPKGGQITVSLEEKPALLTIHVKDTGRGIPEQDLPHLFQRFSQGTSNKRSSGSGLGLYLSRQIVEAHQGKIWVESKEGEGSRFSFNLPMKA